jgi:8-oxo-dGTP pyrophosphatase MutT (NUDIX family)
VSGYTWDGLPIAADAPHGATVVVRRPAPDRDQAEYLVLHRAHHGPDYAGDWAWTPPAGSRQPGEAVLPAALRELAEEGGLCPDPAELRPLDLSGRWVRFLLDVPEGTKARLVDAEHDRFEWLPAAAAIARCLPADVAAGIRQAHRVLAPTVRFRPLALTDLPALLEWQQAPHAARWFPERLDLATAARKYGPRIAGQSPTRVHVAVVDGVDVGFLQHYRVGDYPDYAGATGLPQAVGIDYVIGDPGLTGRGLGPQLIWSYLRDVALPVHPAARHALASPDIGNHQSIRALVKAGFMPAGDIAMPGEASRERLCVLDAAKFFGERAGPSAR